MLKLNLGCGYDIRTGYVNIDMCELPMVDLVYDLNKCRLPFENNSVDEIYCSHAVEHLHDPFLFVMDCHRVLKNGGRLIIKTPTFDAGLCHRTHWFHGDFFRPVSNECDLSNGQTTHLFVVKKKGKISSIDLMVRKVLRLIERIIYSEYEYTLTKTNDS